MNRSDVATLSNMYCTCIRKLNKILQLSSYSRVAEYALIISCFFNYLLESLEFIFFVSLGNSML